MEFTGTIIRALGIRQGTSASGYEWRSASYVIEGPGMYPSRMVFDVRDGMDGRIDRLNIQPGQRLTVHFRISATEGRNGSWWNNIEVYNAYPAKDSAGSASASGGGSGSGSGGAASGSASGSGSGSGGSLPDPGREPHGLMAGQRNPTVVTQEGSGKIDSAAASEADSGADSGAAAPAAAGASEDAAAKKRPGRPRKNTAVEATAVASEPVLPSSGDNTSPYAEEGGSTDDLPF